MDLHADLHKIWEGPVHSSAPRQLWGKQARLRFLARRSLRRIADTAMVPGMVHMVHVPGTCGDLTEG